MGQSSGELAQEVTRLQRCMSDLVSVLALPTILNDGEPRQILETFLDALIRLLDLDFSYAQARVTYHEGSFEVFRTIDPSGISEGDIREGLHQWLAGGILDDHPAPRARIGDREISILPLRLGLEGGLGLIVVGCRRPDFPRQTERIVINVAANQVALLLQQSQILGQQKRVARELDERVVQRTAELAAVGHDLRNEIAERKEIEERLRAGEVLLKKSEAKLWEVIGTIPVIAWSNLPDGSNEFLNKRWSEYTGLSAEESHGWGWQAAMHAEDLEVLMNKRRAAMISGQRSEVEGRFRRYDGIYRWFLIRDEPFCDEAGRIVRWYGTSTDIHDRKVVEDELKRSEERYRVVVETASDVVISMNESGVVILANAATKRIFGYEAGELIGRPLTMLMPESMQKPHASGYERYVRTGERHVNWQGAEFIARRANGKEFPVEVSFGEMNAGGQRIFTGFIRDISEKKRAERALLASERSLSLIINTMPVLAWSARPDGSRDFINQRWLSYTGLSAAQAQDWGWVQATHPKDLDRITDYWQSILKTGEAGEIEFRLRRFDGSYRWFLFRASPLLDQSGAIVKWYGTNTDIDDLKQAEEALRESEDESRLIVDSIPGLITVVTTGGEIERANLPVFEYFGKLPEDLGNWSTGDSVHAEDRSGVIQAIKQALTSGDPADFEARLRRFDGVYRWFHIRGLPLRDRQGRIVRWYFLDTDVDEVKRAEEALKSRSRDLKLTIDTIPALVWSARADGSVDFFSQRWLNYTGLSPAEAQEWGWTQAFHPEDMERLTIYWQSMMVSGEAGEIEARLRRFDGYYRWFFIRADALRDEGGTIVRWYGTNTDIDDRKRAEEGLRQSEINLRQITETIPEMLWSATPDGAIDYCNGRLLDYTGFRAEEVMYDGWMRLVYPDDLDASAQAWRLSIAIGSPFRVEARIFHVSDKTYRWCVASARPLLDELGRIVKWHGTVVDMHDWKKAQEEIRETQAELAKMMRVTTMGQLTASIAHEVNQPLSGIMTNAGTCLRMLDSDPANIDGARETARRTLRDGKRASEVIARLRSLFNNKEVVSEPVDLNDAAREVIALLLSELQRSEVIVRHEFADNLPAVKGDRVQLQQVILNLLRNATDAMGGVERRARRLFIRTEQDGEDVRLTVRDSGVGFDPAAADRLFESFYTTKRDGMGIGLAVSRSIIEAHGGRLWATTNDGPGATFAFSIPCDISGQPAKDPGE